jgi:alkylated DNA repair dioxygenase AlkB
VASAQKIELMLDAGSVLDMRGPIQQYWYHALPPSKKVKALRVNLTFRLLIK